MNNATDVSEFASQLSLEQQERLADILDQFLIQCEQGLAPDIEKLCEQQEQLAPAIRHYAKSLRLLADAVGEVGWKAKGDENHSTTHKQSTAPNQRIGDYEVLREIGRGGMGVVYEAVQVSLDRRVALKILPFAAVLDQRQIARFQNEAQAAAQLHHPHIVPVYSIGSDRGTYFYSMQFIDGQSLEHLIAGLQSGCDLWSLASQPNPPEVISCDRNGTTIDVGVGDLDAPPFGDFADTESSKKRVTHATVRSRNHVRRIAELGVQAAEAIHYANEHGIVHRDIKPSNLLIDREGKLWIADFGLAQCVGLGSLTRSGDVLGTLRYMSPEQAAGKTHWIDNRTDIYSLGVTLYELLTLNPAVESNDRMAMMRQIQNERPTSLSRLNPSVPFDLENIVYKAISKEREDRYSTAGELAEDLQRWLDGKATMARRPSVVDLTARWVSNHARAVTIGVAVLLFLFSIASVTASLFRAKNRDIEAANNLALKHLSHANEVVDRFGTQLLTKLEWLPGTEELQQEVAQNSIDYLNAFAEYASNDPNQLASVGSALVKLAKLQELRGADLDAIGTYRRAAQTLKDSAIQLKDREMSDEAFACHNNLACVLMRIGRSEEALRGFSECIEMVCHSERRGVSQKNKNALRQALLRLNLGHLFREQGEVRYATREFETAWTLLRKVGVLGKETSSDLVADLQHMLVTALLQVASGDLYDSESAVGMLRHALSLSQANAIASVDSVAAQHEVCVCQLALGVCMSKKGDKVQAKSWFEKAVASLHQLAAKSPASVRLLSDEASAWNNLGQADLELGNIQEAMSAFSSSRKILEALAVDSSDYSLRSNLGGIYHNQAIVEEMRGNLESAQSLLIQAIDHQKTAMQAAPDCKRCRTFLSEHRSLLSQVANKTLSKTDSVSPLTNGEIANEKL